MKKWSPKQDVCLHHDSTFSMKSHSEQKSLSNWEQRSNFWGHFKIDHPLLPENFPRFVGQFNFSKEANDNVIFLSKLTLQTLSQQTLKNDENVRKSVCKTTIFGVQIWSCLGQLFEALQWNSLVTIVCQKFFCTWSTLLQFHGMQWTWRKISFEWKPQTMKQIKLDFARKKISNLAKNLSCLHLQAKMQDLFENSARHIRTLHNSCLDLQMNMLVTFSLLWLSKSTKMVKLLTLWGHCAALCTFPQSMHHFLHWPWVETHFVQQCKHLSEHIKSVKEHQEILKMWDDGWWLLGTDVLSVLHYCTVFCHHSEVRFCNGLEQTPSS